MSDTTSNVYLPAGKHVYIKIFVTRRLVGRMQHPKPKYTKSQKKECWIGQLAQKQRDSARRRKSTRLNQAQEDSFLVWMKLAGIYVFCSGFVFCSSCANSAGSR